MKLGTKNKAVFTVSLLAKAALLSATAMFAVSCASPTPKASLRHSAGMPKQPAAAGPEYFSEKKYGVKASPRVASHRSRIKRGGGRYQLGKPYKVRGRWYKPREDKNYDKTGNASWYGQAFHGRLTANGEIYDMTHLTAAHPTMPLPSYARVTNLKNGNSVIVRVNDRGPFAHNRIIDLSARAAQLLDYTENGTAKVRVQYVGRAPLDGHDDQYLMASYQPGNGQRGPSGLPNTMIASASGNTVPAAGLPGVDRSQGIGVAPAGSAYVPASTPVPALKAANPIAETPPIPTPKPGFKYDPTKPLPTLAYADRRIASASAFDHLFAKPEEHSEALTAEKIAASWNRSAKTNEIILVGTYSSRSEAQRIAGSLNEYGVVEILSDLADATGEMTVSVQLNVSTDRDTDTVLDAIWKSGIQGAFVLR